MNNHFDPNSTGGRFDSRMAERYAIGETALPSASVVPEALKKKVARNVDLKAKKDQALLKTKKDNQKKRFELKMRASKYAREYKMQDQQLVRLRREAKKTGNFFVEPEAKVMLVVRITGINHMAPKPRKIFKLLRLDQLHKAVLVKVSAPMINMLKPIMPYIICGNPNLQTIKQLVLKRGYGRVNKERQPIDNNEMISAALGDVGIHGVDDLIHELYTVGPNFKRANNFLWAFKLSSPNGGFVLKKHGYMEPKGGDWGNREELINEIVRRMI